MWRRFPILAAAVIAACGCLTSLLAKPPAKIHWQYDIQAAQKSALKQKKPLLVVVGGPGCSYCRLLDQNTLSDPAMVEFVNSRFIPVHLDFERNHKECEILEIESLPTTVVLSADADMLGEVVGYRNKGEFRKALDEALKAGRQLQTASGEK